MGFYKLKKTENGFCVIKKKPFADNARNFKKETIEQVFEFAYSMTFAGQGEHRNHRSGGSEIRKNGQIFADAFQGKLAECAVCNLIHKLDPSAMPDFSVATLGIWDSVDVTVNGKKINVKSTKSKGQLLLLETKDWDEQGRYIPNIKSGCAEYDYFLLVRISPFCSDAMAKNKWLYNDEIEKDKLREEIKSYDWSYDFAGYITAEQLRYIIKENFIIKKGVMLNGTTKMDADNYYVQAYDMGDAKDMVAELEKISEPSHTAEQ